MLAVITGASSGIGAAFARHLAQQAYDVLLIARRRNRLEELARDLTESYGIRAEILEADLCDPADLEQADLRVRSAPDLAMLVNNAGFGTNGYFWEVDLLEQERMQLLHVVATARLTHAALANLTRRAARGTGVINVSSVAAFGGGPLNVGYCATKAWMNMFTATLSAELRRRSSPVKVQALCPGFTLSEFHDVLKTDRSAIPGWLWLTSDFVVQESLAAFARGKLIVVPGIWYKLLVTFMRWTPEALIRHFAGRAVQKYRRSSSRLHQADSQHQ